MELWKRYKNQKGLLKYLVSYIVVFLLPVLFLLFYFYPQTSTIIQETAIDNSNAMLSQTVSNIDRQMEIFWNYPDAIHKNNHLNSQLFSEDNSFNTYHIMQEMEKMFGYNLFVEKTLLYNKQSGTFYSFPGSYSKEEFSERDSTFYYSDWDKEEMLRELDEINEIVIRPAEQVNVGVRFNSSYDAVTIMMPVPYKNRYSYAVLMLVIPEQNFFLNQKGKDDIQPDFFVFGKNDDLLAMSNGENQFTENDFSEILADTNHLVERVTIAGEQYLVNFQESRLYGLKYLSLTPLESILYKINQLKTVTFMLVLLILTVEAILIFLFMRTNYAPIRKLRQKALASVQSMPSKELNEFEIVSYAFDSLHNENLELISKVMLNKNISKEYFLIQCLNGTLPKDDDMIQQALEHNIQLRKKVCCVTFYAEDRNIISLLALLKSMMDFNSELDHTFSYMVKGMRHEDFILIMSFDEEERIKPYHYKLHEVEENIRVGIGTIEEVELLNNSYIHSLAALESAILNKDLKVVGYDHIDVKSSNVLSQLFDIIKIIELSITRRDEEQFKAQLNKLIDLMRTKVSSIFILKVIFINTYNVLAKELNKFGVKEEYCYAMSEKELNIEQLEEKLRSMGQKLSNELLKSDPIKGSVDIKEVLLYLDKYYMEASISMQRLADEFNLSYSNFSHFFKKKTGENFAAYLERLRINKAKQLLIQGKEPIKSIAEQVGYINANSFTRSFKKLENMAPGEYRKLDR
ncbi:helix-turn-helix domain-containing protein [Alkalihalobacillus sp. 1P02AB]|uniref:helix-turn-helix domain-containing protein n=1 Tax=Alkalihalobacillus sp. 1P02AB TaxID=3132260 RepID=UPI0039A66A99